MDDDFGDDADLTAALDAVEKSYTPRPAPISGNASSINAPKVQQPKPQALPNRTAPSSILVSPRQKGNPILNNIRSLPWEYSDIPSDYVLGNTTCALFLSLKYHRLHPEYIYSRIRALGGKYNLRVLLTMVDIQNHEESLKELSKTSLINNLTLILCWSAQEAGRYLELFKSYEHASPTSIRAQQATSYSEKLVEFITVPRSINKTDAVGLVSSFGSVRAAVNARPEELGLIAGWGEKKVQRWCSTVRANFRVRKSARRGIGFGRESTSMAITRENSWMEGEQEEESSPARTGVGAPVPISMVPSRPASGVGAASTSAIPDADKRPSTRTAEDVPMWQPGEDEEEALLLAAAEEEMRSTSQKVKQSASVNERAADPAPKDGEMSEGVIAALARLREKRGLNTWDTANVYSDGVSEEIIGKAIKKYNLPRHKLVILSKCNGTVGEEHGIMAIPRAELAKSKDYINQAGLSRQAIFSAVDASLRRLQTDYLDLLQIHRFDASVPIEETMEALHDLVKNGKVRYLGASSMWTYQFAMMQFTAEKRSWTKFVSMQNHYNLLYREEEREMNKFCHETGWGPLCRGHLARPPTEFGNTTRSAGEKQMTFLTTSQDKVDQKIIGRVQELAEKKGWKMSHVALAWINKRITSPIIGFSSVERMDEALDARGKTLTEDEEKYLEQLYQTKAIQGHQ